MNIACLIKGHVWDNLDSDIAIGRKCTRKKCQEVIEPIIWPRDRVTELYEKAISGAEGFSAVNEELKNLELGLDWNHHLSLMKGIATSVLGDKWDWKVEFDSKTEEARIILLGYRGSHE